MSISSSAFAQVEVIHGKKETVYRVAIEDIHFSKSETAGNLFSTVQLKGVKGHEGILYKEGNPEIPVVRLIVEGKSVAVSESSDAELVKPKFDLPLKPIQPSAPKIRGAKTKFVVNNRLYKSSKPYPFLSYTVEPAGSVRGKARWLVTLHPVSYQPSSGAIGLRKNFEVRVQNEEPKTIKESSTAAIAFVVGAQFANSAAIARYKAFKESQGYRVPVILFGRDANSPMEVREKLRQLYAASSFRLEHALLIGDARDVPGHNSSHISGMTDQYFASLDVENYESDIHAPDIGVGRFSVANETQLQAVVDKSIAYQRGIFAQERWLEQAAFLATDDRWQIAEGSHNYAIDTHTNRVGYTGIFPQANQPGGDKLYAVTYRVPNAVVQEAMGQGRTIINYSGHGAHTLWDAPRVTPENVRSLRSDSALPFVISNACITGDYRIDESFAETWQRHRYGAIMFWGSMDSTYWDEDDILERRMFDGIYTLGKRNFTEITQHALTEHWRHYGGAGRSIYYWETYVVFGDPSIELRTARTQEVQIEGPREIPVGIDAVEFNLRMANGIIPMNARVSFIDEAGTPLATSIVSGSGIVRFSPPAALAPGRKVRMIVRGQNLRESEIEMLFISPNTPYLTLRNFTANGREGNLVGAGEAVALNFTAFNVGRVDAAAATIALESVSGPAVAIAGNSGISGIPAGGSVVVDGNQFRIRILPEAVMGDVVQVTLFWQTSDGISGRAKANFQVAKAKLDIVSLNFGPGEFSGIRPGTAGPMEIVLRNSGMEAMTGTWLEIVGGTCATSVRELLRVDGGVIAPGAEFRLLAPANVMVDANCRSGDRVEFTLSGAYTGFGGLLPIATAGSFTAGVVGTVDYPAAGLGHAIPDNGSAIEHQINVSQSGLIADIGIEVGILHSYIGDLVIELVHPDGTAVTLHENQGGSIANLDLSMGLLGQPLAALATLHGKPTQGQWKLRVRDTASSDIGTLERVRLMIRGYIE